MTTTTGLISGNRGPTGSQDPRIPRLCAAANNGANIRRGGGLITLGPYRGHEVK
jgi:hypothetical protein